MRSILVIGMGTFGKTLANRLLELGNEVMVVDSKGEKIDEVSGIFGNAAIANCANKDVLASFNIPQFDICFVAIAGDFQASLEITSILCELGAKRVISKARSELQAKVLQKCGADEIVFPERDLAEKLAIKFSTKNIFDFLSIADGYGVYEIRIPESWNGKSLSQLNVRQKHRVNVLAVKSKDGIIPLSDAEYVFNTTDKKDSLLVLGNNKDVSLLH